MLVLLMFLLTILFAISVSAVNNQQYHLKLLAVQETINGYEGSDADLYLELKEGSGRVFLETTPLTKFDTQISTKFAKEIACKQYKLDCNKYDFIYTIKAKSNIIGGPSAGAAIAALTTIAVLDLNYDEEVTITGTINSGGIVGPIGGVKEKLEAASKAGLKKVLVAKGTAGMTPSENSTEFNLLNYSENNLSLEVIEVIDLDEVILHLANVDLNGAVVEIVENVEYQEIMKNLKNLLCGRNEEIRGLIESENFNDEIVFNESAFKIEKAINASNEGDYYSAASFCFSDNINLKEYYYRETKLSSGKMTQLVTLLEKDILNLELLLEEEKIETIADLQTLMIVKERINDVKKNIEEFWESKNSQELTDAANLLGYAEERLFSARSWMEFFSMDGKKIVFNQDLLKNSCVQKISESKERYQYVSLFIDIFNLKGIFDKIKIAEDALAKDEYTLCLITAAQAKADANAVLGSLGLSEDDFDGLIESKISVVEKVISENSAEKIFPILGYSYYQYANSLKEQNVYDALVFLEYALEMSDLSIYFPEEESFIDGVWDILKFDFDWISFFFGVIVACLVFIILRKK